MIKYMQIIINCVQNLTCRAHSLSLFDKFHCWVKYVKWCTTISCPQTIPQTSFWKRKWLYINYYNVTSNKKFFTPTLFCQCGRGYTECFLAQVNRARGYLSKNACGFSGQSETWHNLPYHQIWIHSFVWRGKWILHLHEPNQWWYYLCNSTSWAYRGYNWCEQKRTGMLHNIYSFQNVNIVDVLW